MTTDRLVETLRCTYRRDFEVSIRYALFSYLYEMGVSINIISKATGYNRGTVYHGIYSHRDKLRFNDILSKNAEEVIREHQINVKPATVNGIIPKIVGYKLIVDNIVI